jgi:predicted aldo/keto reductase-like oxidoreductase
MGSEERLDRREFLRRTAIAGLGAGLLPLAASAIETPGVRRYVPLGRTGLEVSDIGFGTADLVDDVSLVHHALERGINYFDTADSYGDGETERILGRALKGQRHRVVLTTKAVARPGTTRDQLMQGLEASLERLQTDRVDIYFNHAVNDVKRLKIPEWYEFVERAKGQGKIRFSGMSGHGTNLIQCLHHVFDHELVDVVLSAFNFAEDPGFYLRLRLALEENPRSRGLLRRWGFTDWVATQRNLPAVLAKGKQKGIGIVCMKTLRGARLNDMRRYEQDGATFAQAAFRWVLSNPAVDSLIVSMDSRPRIDEFLVASGWRQQRKVDLALLQRYEEKNATSQCRHGCSLCEDSCPHGVAIPEVLRTRMYARDYGKLDLARREYARLGAGASACLSCAHQSCTGACPFGLEIEKRTTETHRLLAADRGWSPGEGSASQDA